MKLGYYATMDVLHVCKVFIMYLIAFYLLVLLALSIYLLLTVVTGNYLIIGPEQLQSATACCALACVGGCLYCIRAVYLNKCVYDRWSKDWYIWYFLRPIASFVCGGVSFLFLQAGLLVLDANTSKESSHLGFYALAFISGLNVDKFLAKIEDVAKAVFGIEKTRAAEPKKIEGNTNG